MTDNKQQIRSSKSSYDQPFELLHDSHSDQHSRPSQSIDFQQINFINQEKKTEDLQQNKLQKAIRRKSIKSDESNLICNENALLKQIELLKQQIKTKDENINKLESKLQEYKNINSALIQKLKIKQAQKQNIIEKCQQVTLDQIKVSSQRLNDLQIQINSLKMKLQVYQEQDKKIRHWAQKQFKISPYSQKMSSGLLVLVQSVIIQLQTNLKQIKKQIQKIIVKFKLEGYQKINGNRSNGQKYNHWQLLNHIQTIKQTIIKKL